MRALPGGTGPDWELREIDNMRSQQAVGKVVFDMP